MVPGVIRSLFCAVALLSFSVAVADDRLSWQKEGFGEAEAAIWSSNGFSLEQSRLWKKQGYTVDRARDKRDRYDSFVANNCKKGVEEGYKLLEANPYDVEGRCFTFMGNALQIFSKTTGLYNMYGTNSIAFVDFGQEIAPKYDFTVRVIGTGAYSYETASGALNTVPAIKTISIP